MLSYCWGCAFNLSYVFLYEKDREIVSAHGLLTGFTSWTWAYVVLQAAMGLSVSFMFRYQDNIARIFAVGASTVTTLFLSAPAFGRPVTPTAVLAVCIIVAALLIYYDGQAKHSEADRAAEAAKGAPAPAPTEGAGLLAEPLQPTGAAGAASYGTATSR